METQTQGPPDYNPIGSHLSLASFTPADGRPERGGLMAAPAGAVEATGDFLQQLWQLWPSGASGATVAMMTMMMMMT